MIITFLLAVGAGLLGLSGVAALDSAKERFECAAAEYRRLIAKSESATKELKGKLRSIGEKICQAVNNLNTANKILSPLGRGTPIPAGRNFQEIASAALSVLGQSSLVMLDFSAASAAGVGLGVGSAVAAGSWAAVSMLGTASTGATIGGLHGVAATNAALAWFGHGSLAAGGAGMAGGTLALGGIILLPAVAIAGGLAHIKASEIDEQSAGLERANAQNANVLTKQESQLADVRGLLTNLNRESTALAHAVAEANDQLFHYGWLSRAHKFLRQKFWGYYYTSNDMDHIERLANAVDHFIATMHGSGAGAHKLLLKNAEGANVVRQTD